MNAQGATQAVGDVVMQDRRLFQRYQPEANLRVREAGSGLGVGDVDDISLGGFRMVSRKAYVPNSRQRFLVDMYIDGFRTTHIEVGVRCAWCETDADSGVVRAGFEFLEMALDDQETLVAFIVALAD